MATTPTTTPKKIGETTADAVQEATAAVTKGVEVTEKAFQENISNAAAGFEKTQAEVKATLEKTQADVKANVEKALKTAEQFLSFGQGNVEAIVKSSQIWVAGVQDLSKHVAATAQAQLDQTVSAWKALAAAKSLKEALDLQTGLARTSLEKAVAETGKLTDASLKLAEQAMAPITARVTLAVEKFGRSA